MNGPEENGICHSPKKPARQSAAIYRRRRLAVAFLLLCSIVLCAAIVSVLTGFLLGGSVKSEASEGAAGEASAITSLERDSASTEPGDSRKCDASKVIITLRSDAKIYSDDQHPKFGVTIENKNQAECDINLGTKEMNYNIRQGDNEVFSSQYCVAGELTDWPRRLASEAVVGIEDFVWQRTFTQKGCPESSTKPNQALPGNYSLTVQVGPYTGGPLYFALK